MLKGESANQFQTNMNAMTEELEPLKKALLIQNAVSEIYQFGVEEIAGRKILYAKRREDFFQLDSMYDSQELLEKWRMGIDALYNSKYLMFGIGNGMFVRTLLKNTGKDVKIFVYEPTIQSLQLVLSEFDFTDILSSDRVQILCGEMETGENDLYTLWAENLDYADIQGARLSEYLNYAKIFPEEYKRFVEIYDQVMEGVISNRVVLQRFGISYYYNTFWNYSHFCLSKSIASLWAYIPEGITAIIVSSGPSLNKNIEELRHAKGKSIIIAADSAVSVLLKHDIIPDIYVCVDASKNPKHFEDDRVKDIPFVGSVHTCAAAMGGHRAPRFFINDANPHIQKFLTEHNIVLPLLSSGGSVATDAMSFAEAIGIRKFILVGQDLAYTNNKTHAEGSLRATWDIDISPTSCYLEGADGELILSSAEFKLYRDWFEREIALKSDLIVVNATEGGAKIHGAKVSTLKDAIAEYCIEKVSVSDIFSLTADLFPEKKRVAFTEYMDSIEVELQSVFERIRQGIYDYKKMKKMVLEKSYHNQKFIKLFGKTKALAEYLENTPVMYYPECLVQERVSEFLKNVYRIEDDEQKELLEVVEKGLAYLNMMKDAVERVKLDIVERLHYAKFCLTTALEKKIKEFQEDEVRKTWEMFHSYINPDMTMEGYIEFVQFLDQILELKERAEYSKLLEIMYNHCVLLKSDMILCQDVILSFLYAVTSDIMYLEVLEQKICKNPYLHDRQRYYLWYYLNRKNDKIGKSLYQQLIHNYYEKLKDSIELLKNKNKKMVTVAVITRDFKQGTENIILDKCVKAVQSNRKVIVVLSEEYGAQNGMLPLYGEPMVPKKIMDPITEITYNNQVFACIMPSKPMPNIGEYKEILQKLRDYHITNILSEEGSVLGKLLKKVLEEE